MSIPFAFAYETVTVPSGNVTVSLTSTVFSPATGGLPCCRALVTVNPGPPISYGLTTTLTVASAVGHKLTAYGSLVIDGYNQILRFSTTSVSSGTVGSISVTYFRGVNS